MSLIVKNTITINAAPAVVWDLLTKPQYTVEYMFGCEPISDWQVGSELLWCAHYEGENTVFVQGEILAIDVPNLLVYTTFDPDNNEIPDIPTNYLTVSYHLAAENDTTILTVTQGDYSIVANGAARYEQATKGGGWQSILEQIKKLTN
jgi:uncharacterized protein YndB with AHSA1/START domain